MGRPLWQQPPVAASTKTAPKQPLLRLQAHQSVNSLRAQQCALAVADAPAPTIGFSTVLLMRLPYCSSAVLQPWQLPAVPFPAFWSGCEGPCTSALHCVLVGGHYCSVGVCAHVSLGCMLCSQASIKVRRAGPCGMQVLFCCPSSGVPNQAPLRRVVLSAGQVHCQF
jgi:hypothetical protein